MLRRARSAGHFWRVCAVTLGVLLPLAFAAPAQDDEAPPPKKPGVQITFLPPPMQGSLSLGIYDKKGRLVRTLVREGSEKDFVVGLNGLIIQWDGKDDAGKQAPPGTYAVHGYSVGAIDVEGIALHGNDWISDDDSPHYTRILDLEAKGNDTVDVILKAPDGMPRHVPVQFDTAPDSAPETKDAVTIAEGKLSVVKNGDAHQIPLADGETAIDATVGTSERIWAIVQTPQGREVRAFSPEGEFLRRLAYAPEDPQPRRILAARGTFPQRWSEQILLLEENDKIQQVRSLALPQKPATGETPAWETVLEKAIWIGTTFDAVKDRLPHPNAKAFIPDKEFVVHLINNPLLKDEPTTAHVNIGFNDKGSYLQTTDGLPLRRITETRGLQWAVIGREGSGKLLTVFQSDGSVVEEFRARKLANMMAFDAGDYELK